MWSWAFLGELTGEALKLWILCDRRPDLRWLSSRNRTKVNYDELTRPMPQSNSWFTQNKLTFWWCLEAVTQSRSLFASSEGYSIARGSHFISHTSQSSHCFIPLICLLELCYFNVTAAIKKIILVISVTICCLCLFFILWNHWWQLHCRSSHLFCWWYCSPWRLQSQSLRRVMVVEISAPSTGPLQGPDGPHAVVLP